MFLTLYSKNSKVGDVAATYAPIRQTCPDSCPLRESGCYARSGNVGFQVNRLERLTGGMGGDLVAILEADEIRDAGQRLRRRGMRRDLRLHVSGDATTPFRAKTISDACRQWPGRVWSYTHAWRDVPRASWGAVSVLASVECLDDAKAALRAGYAPAIVVSKHDSSKAKVVDGVRLIPCPSQTNGVACVDCRLCFDDCKLRSLNAAIAFEAHGVGKKRALTVIR